MEDFNLPTGERITLLSRLQELIGDVPLCFWAACQTCDIKALEKLIEVAYISPPIVRILAGQTLTMALYWIRSSRGSLQATTPRKSSPSLGNSSPASSGSPSKKRRILGDEGATLARSQAARALAERRDNFRCVLTGVEMGREVAHIYLYFSLKRREETFGPRYTFWEHLKYFWPEEKVITWQVELFPSGINEIGVEKPYNLITLAGNVHNAWNNGAFALKPISISDDNTTLKVQFFWQKKLAGTQEVVSLLTAPPSSEGLEEGGDDFDLSAIFLVRRTTYRPIQSGDFFELQTDDPITKPLPSFKLLEMQWFLQRVVGMAGAAGPYELDWDEDSDGEISNIGLDDAGEGKAESEKESETAEIM